MRVNASCSKICERQVISHLGSYSEDYESISEEKFKKRVEQLKNYLGEKTGANSLTGAYSLSSIDKLLMKYLSEEIIGELDLNI